MKQKTPKTTKTTPVRPAPTIVCDSCGAEFDANLPACPYCGTVYEIPAERAYQRKLQGMRRDLSNMQSVSKESVHGAAGNLFRWLGRLGILAVIIIGIAIASTAISRKNDLREQETEYIWRMENEPTLEEYYKNGQYEEMVDFYWNALDEGHTLYNWKRGPFVSTLADLFMAEETLRAEADGAKIYSFEMESLVRFEIESYGFPYCKDYSEEDIAFLNERCAPLQADLVQRIDISQEELDDLVADMKRNNGHLYYETLDRFVKSKLE